MTIIQGKTYDEERALYGSRGLLMKDCVFDGPADGESACKESSDVSAADCRFCLRYPFWHCRGVSLSHCTMEDTCRAALWYSENIRIADSSLYGIKALRECRDAELTGCGIRSPEFGWMCGGVHMENCTAESEYFMFRSEDLTFRGVELKGKYSLQYVRNVRIENCRFDTKDTLWHAKNAVIRDCVISGAYLAWYSENLTFENCVLSGTQPFCYCKNLTLVNCELRDADLSFEKSEVCASLTAPILSIKNPLSGRITVPSVGELIRDDPESRCVIETEKRSWPVPHESAPAASLPEG